MQRGVFYYKALTHSQKKLTEAVAGTSRQQQCSSSCVVPSEEANAAMVSQHALTQVTISTCCSTAR